MILGIVIFSFYLEGILSKTIDICFLIPLTTVMSLILIYPYLYNCKKNYYIICFITGLIYDITYTNTFMLNASIFLLLGYLIFNINIIITNNSFNVILIGLLIIFIYRILTYLILVFIDYTEFSINVLFKSIGFSLLFNIIYISLMYKMTDVISKKIGIYKKD